MRRIAFASVLASILVFHAPARAQQPALDANQRELIWGRPEQLLIWLHRLAPRLVQRLLGTQRRRFARAFRPVPQP